MARRIGAKRRAKLIQDIFSAQHDVVALAQAHGLSPDDLATWAGDERNQNCLVGLCVLADLQTQLLLSRYRLLAAERLIRLATDEEAGSGDVARKACVDLLKLDLKRAEASDFASVAAEPSAPDAGALRKLFYGENDDDQ
ncbi:MAG: hypothetical protein ACLFV3_06770 [Phycisphaeraceae bacterium]